MKKREGMEGGGEGRQGERGREVEIAGDSNVILFFVYKVGGNQTMDAGYLWERFPSDIEKMLLVGEGTFGEVYSGVLHQVSDIGKRKFDNESVNVFIATLKGKYNTIVSDIMLCVPSFPLSPSLPPLSLSSFFISNQ